jgi:hypothetical protein
MIVLYTNAPKIMIAEKASDLLHSNRSPSTASIAARLEHV